jgi:hypothetical protein
MSSLQFFGAEVKGVWDSTGGAVVGLGTSLLSGEGEKNIATTAEWAVTSPGKIGEALKEAGHEVAQTVDAAASGNPRAFGQVIGMAATAAYTAENVRVLRYKSGGGGLNIYDTPTTGSRIALDVQRIKETGGTLRPHVDITVKKPGMPVGEGSNLINIKHWPW